MRTKKEIIGNYRKTIGSASAHNNKLLLEVIIDIRDTLRGNIK